MLEVQINSIEQMHRLAALIAETASGGDLIGLSGELGSGKTEFAKGFAKSLGCSDLVVSPTYNIEIIYNLNHAKYSELRHFDCYRLIDSSDLEPYRECSLSPESLSLIEWPEKVEGLKDLLSLHLHIKFVGSKDEKRAVFMETAADSSFKDLDLESFNE